MAAKNFKKNQSCFIQDEHPVAYASRALTVTERNYAQIEKECLAIVFATQRFEHYILGKKDIVVQSDHKPLMSIFAKPILSSPKRLQRMRLRLQKYSLKVEYKPGPTMYISDTLSRAYLPVQQVEPSMKPYLIFQLEQERQFRDDIAQIDMETSVFVSDERLQSVRLETNKDATMQTLMSIINAGWPEAKSQVPLCVRDFWECRDELVTHNGIVYRGMRIVIPHTLRATMITRAHNSHQGIVSTSKTARVIMFWPRMNADLTEAVQRCSTCQEYQPAQQKEPLMTHPLATLPWQVVATDCFEISGQHYCVLVDTYSDYVEVCQLDDMTSATLINNIKPIFATHGVPTVLISDNGPNYASQEFANFAKSWDFQHQTSSPHHHKSNGKAESAVKIIKSLVRKTQKHGGDMWKAILEWRNSPSPNLDTSPAQRLLSRRTRSFLPCTDALYKPQVAENVLGHVIDKRRKAKKFHDQSSKPLPDLVVGQPIRAATHPQLQHSTWVPGVVEKQVAPRSYVVKVGDRSYRRNRVHIRDTLQDHRTAPSDEQLPEEVGTSFVPDDVPPNVHRQEPTQAAPPEPPRPGCSTTVVREPPAVGLTPSAHVTTRSGRVSQPPARFRDC